MIKLLTIFTVLAIASARHKHFYRKDYTYIEEFDAFYKLHWDKDTACKHCESWKTAALLACDDEGAQLFYSKEDGEWTIVKKLKSYLAEPPNTTDVIVGAQDQTGLGDFVTIDGQPIPMPLLIDQSVDHGKDCVIMDMETGSYKVEPCPIDSLTKRLFVCKKVDEKPCPTIDSGYKYVEEFKKCYKVNKRKHSWQEAWRTCFMEGGLLAMPESYAELKVFIDMLEKKVDYFAGYKKIQPHNESDFYTVKGQKLWQTDFQNWYAPKWAGEKYDECGALIKDDDLLYLRSRKCEGPFPFICEMKANV